MNIYEHMSMHVEHTKQRMMKQTCRFEVPCVTIPVVKWRNWCSQGCRLPHAGAAVDIGIRLKRYFRYELA